MQFYTSGAAYFTEGRLDEAAFKLNRVRLEMLGSFSPKFSYHFRQSFNKYSNPHSLDNLSSSIEYAYVGWRMSDLQLGAGADGGSIMAGRTDVFLSSFSLFLPG